LNRVGEAVGADDREERNRTRCFFVFRHSVALSSDDRWLICAYSIVFRRNSKIRRHVTIDIRGALQSDPSHRQRFAPASFLTRIAFLFSFDEAEISEEASLEIIKTIVRLDNQSVQQRNQSPFSHNNNNNNLSSNSKPNNNDSNSIPPLLVPMEVNHKESETNKR